MTALAAPQFTMQSRPELCPASGVPAIGVSSGR